MLGEEETLVGEEEEMEEENHRMMAEEVVVRYALPCHTARASAVGDMLTATPAACDANNDAAAAAAAAQAVAGRHGD